MLAIVLSVLSVTVCEISANQIQCKKFDLENEVKVKKDKKRDLRHSTGKFWFYIGDFVKNNVRSAEICILYYIYIYERQCLNLLPYKQLTKPISNNICLWQKTLIIQMMRKA